MLIHRCLEERKSIEYRIELDEELNLQLQTINAIQEAIPFKERYDTCIHLNSSRLSKSLTEYDLNRIKPLILQSSTYRKECF